MDYGQIGEGGFGTVYKIRRERYGMPEKVALKVISIPQSEDEVDFLHREGMDNKSITTRPFCANRRAGA